MQADGAAMTRQTGERTKLLLGSLPFLLDGALTPEVTVIAVHQISVIKAAIHIAAQ